MLYTRVLGMQFQSTLPIQGETIPNIDFQPIYIFQSTLPIQGETFLMYCKCRQVKISIHSPYTGRDTPS